MIKSTNNTNIKQHDSAVLWGQCFQEVFFNSKGFIYTYKLERVSVTHFLRVTFDFADFW